MTTSEWAQFTLTILSILGIAITAIRWYIRTQTKPIYDLVQDIQAETKTNGGSSMRDEIKAIKCEQEETRELRKITNSKIDHMYEILLEYISRSK